MHPYNDLPSQAFWKPAISERHMLEIEELWEPKFQISPKDKVSTYGSCFAQHIGRALRVRGFTWYQCEPAPSGLSAANLVRFNYDIFSSRTANIYTTSLLRQWAEWAFGNKPVPEEVWEANGRFFDPFRPRIEPDGFVSVEELRRSREEALRAFRQSVTEANFFVFTLGLTERWLNTLHGYEYPMCPGTAGGTFSSDVHAFDNMSFQDVLEALRGAMQILRKANPKLRFILTVSPVPLTATKSGKHVLIATMQSKSILRAVAGQIADHSGRVDYFPSYEIISSPVFRGSFFEPNQRSVAAAGVKFVMDTFFQELERKFGPIEPIERVAPERSRPSHGDVVCEEELLGAFGGKRP